MTYPFTGHRMAGHGHFSDRHRHWGGGGDDGQSCGSAGSGAQCACFKSGTRILTARGEIAVEFLRSSDRLITIDGGELPIKWIGWRRINVAAHPEPERVAPICIARGSLGENTPRRDLYVSPDHAMYLNGLLISASALINDVNVAQVRVSDVAYYHVELDEHAIIFAEGAATESFLEREGNRSYFSNSRDATTLHPEFGTGLVREHRESNGVAAQVRDWTLARMAGAGYRLYRVAVGLGLRGAARAAARANAMSMQRLLGTAAPWASFGPAVDEVRREIARRAAAGVGARISPQRKVAA